MLPTVLATVRRMIDQDQFYKVHSDMDIVCIMCAETKFVKSKFVSLRSPVTCFRFKNAVCKTSYVYRMWKFCSLHVWGRNYGIVSCRDTKYRSWIATVCGCFTSCCGSSALVHYLPEMSGSRLCSGTGFIVAKKQ